ncbi:ATP synthase complex assembly protein atp12 [Borealophlyctis nickersoniae]|nr:ATP synthase complex assembly protein atp12 [Borealophlyctis nickersoniae]
MLDHRTLKTPDGHPVVVPPSKPLLAQLVAAEWEGQANVLKTFSLPLTSIVVRSIDSLKDETTRKGVMDNLIKYLQGDSVCYHQDYPDSFVKMQDDAWRPLIAWVEQEMGMKVSTTTGFSSVKQSEELVAKMRAVMEDFNPLTLAAFEKAVLSTKSFIIGLAVVRRRISVEEAAKAASLEVLHQIDRWGEVEDRRTSNASWDL